MSDRNKLIDLLRTASILVVLATHFAIAANVTTEATPIPSAWMLAKVFNKLWHLLNHNGLYGVTVFFVLSGFLITNSILAGQDDNFHADLKDFYRKRVARICPLLILHVMLGVLFLVGPFPDSNIYRLCFKTQWCKIDLGFFVSIATFTFNWLKVALGQPSGFFGMHWDILWSLAIEEQFYFFYPLVLNVARKRIRLQYFLAMVICVGVFSRWLFIHAMPANHMAVYMTSFSGFDLIAMGVLSCLFSQRASTLPRTMRRAAALAAIAAATLLYVFTSTESNLDMIYAPPTLGASIATLIACSSSSTSLKKIHRS